MKGKWNAIDFLRMIGMAEGTSLLLLLFVAMPLKYLLGKPEMVKLVGWAHGVFFISFMMVVAYVFYTRKWKFTKVLTAFIAAFLPFGTFWFDRKLKVEAVAERRII